MSLGDEYRASIDQMIAATEALTHWQVAGTEIIQTGIEANAMEIGLRESRNMVAPMIVRTTQLMLEHMTKLYVLNNALHDALIQLRG